MARADRMAMYPAPHPDDGSVTTTTFTSPVRNGFHQVLPREPQPETVTTSTAPEYAAAMQAIRAVPIRLLEFNRPAHSPWLTVPLAEEEIAIQRGYETQVFVPFEEFVREMHGPQPLSAS